MPWALLYLFFHYSLANSLMHSYGPICVDSSLILAYDRRDIIICKLMERMTVLLQAIKHREWSRWIDWINRVPILSLANQPVAAFLSSVRRGWKVAACLRSRLCWKLRWFDGEKYERRDGRCHLLESKRQIQHCLVSFLGVDRTTAAFFSIDVLCRPQLYILLFFIYVPYSLRLIPLRWKSQGKPTWVTTTVMIADTPHWIEVLCHTRCCCSCS